MSCTSTGRLRQTSVPNFMRIGEATEEVVRDAKGIFHRPHFCHNNAKGPMATFSLLSEGLGTVRGSAVPKHTTAVPKWWTWSSLTSCHNKHTMVHLLTHKHAVLHIMSTVLQISWDTTTGKIENIFLTAWEDRLHLYQPCNHKLACGVFFSRHSCSPDKNMCKRWLQDVEKYSGVGASLIHGHWKQIILHKSI